MMKIYVYKSLLSGWLAIVVAMSCHAQIVIDSAFRSTTLQNQAMIFRDSTNKMRIDEIIKNQYELPFIVSKVSVPNFYLDHTTRWIKFSVINKTIKIKRLVLRVNQTTTDSVDCYTVVQNKVIENVKFRLSSLSNQYKHIPRPTFVIDIVPNVETTFFLKTLKNKNLWLFGMKLFTEEILQKEEQTENVLFGITLGIFVVIGFMLLILFIVHRDIIYLYYNGYLVSLALAILGSISYYPLFGKYLQSFTAHELFFFFFLFLSIFNILFSRKLFDISAKNQWLIKFGNLLILIFSCIIIVIILQFVPLFEFDIDKITTTGISLLLLLFLLHTLVVGITFFHTKRPLATVYIVSVAPSVLLLLIYRLSEVNLIARQPSILKFAPICIILEILVLFLAMAYRFALIFRDKKNLEKTIITNQVEVQEFERRKIAQDLHDDLGATLSALKGSVSKNDISDDSQNLLNKAIADLRAISRRLLPADFETYGFVPSLEKYISDINQQQKIKVTFIAFGNRVKLNPEKELNIYRIITELVNNSTKYSNGQNATVQLIYHQDYLFVSVEDDGVSQKIVQNNLGIGLKSVISRLEYLNAKPIEMSGQKGYTYVFEIPYLPNK